MEQKVVFMDDSFFVLKETEISAFQKGDDGMYRRVHFQTFRNLEDAARAFKAIALVSEHG